MNPIKQRLESLLASPICLSELRHTFDTEFHYVVEILYHWLREERLIVKRHWGKDIEAKLLDSSPSFFFHLTDSIQLKASTSSNILRVATWNINSIRKRIELLGQWLQEQKPSIVVLQETKTPDSSFPHRELLLHGYSSVFYGQKSYNGVAVLANCAIDDVRYGFQNGWDSENKRLIAVLVKGVWIINVYAPQGASVDSSKFEYKLQFYQNLYEELQTRYSQEQPVILLGDLNIAPAAQDLFNPKEMEGKVSFHPKELDALQQLKDWGLHDLFRHLTPSGNYYSWWDYRGGALQKDQGMRIDHIFITNALLHQSQSCWIDKETRTKPFPSDHAPVIADFV